MTLMTMMPTKYKHLQAQLTQTGGQILPEMTKCKQHDRSQPHPKWDPLRLPPTNAPKDVDILHKMGGEMLLMWLQSILSVHTKHCI